MARGRRPDGRPVCPLGLPTAAPLRASAGGVRLSARMDVFRRIQEFGAVDFLLAARPFWPSQI